MGSGRGDSIRLWNDGTDTVHKRGWRLLAVPAEVRRGVRHSVDATRAKYRQPSGWRLDDQLAADMQG